MSDSHVIGHFLIALIGRSGSGKTTVADVLEQKHDLTSVKSWTTRPKRSKTEKGHVFVTEEWFKKAFPKGDHETIAAYTEFNGYRYFAVLTDINIHDVYVIDPAGLESLKERYHGPKKIISIWLNASRETCKKRMLSRGDTPENVESRLANDDLIFTDEARDKCDYIIQVDEKDPDEIADKIMFYRLKEAVKAFSE